MKQPTRSSRSLISVRAGVVLALSLAVGTAATCLCAASGQALAAALMAGGAATGAAVLTFDRIIGNSSRTY